MKDKVITELIEQYDFMSKSKSKIWDLEIKLKELLIEESGLKINNQYLDKANQKIWISSFKLDKWRNDYSIRAIIYKVKKDGTNGMQSHSSYGYNIKDIKIIEEL